MLLKGCEKKIVCLQSEDSRLFREAFFILRPGCESGGEEDMLKEANRILNENLLRRAPRARRLRRLLPALLLGFFTGALVTGTAWLLSALL